MFVSPGSTWSPAADEVRMFHGGDVGISSIGHRAPVAHVTLSASPDSTSGVPWSLDEMAIFSYSYQATIVHLAGPPRTQGEGVCRGTTGNAVRTLSRIGAGRPIVDAWRPLMVVIVTLPSGMCHAHVESNPLILNSVQVVGV